MLYMYCSLQVDIFNWKIQNLKPNKPKGGYAYGSRNPCDIFATEVQGKRQMKSNPKYMQS